MCDACIAIARETFKFHCMKFRIYLLFWPCALCMDGLIGYAKLFVLYIATMQCAVFKLHHYISL